MATLKNYAANVNGYDTILRLTPTEAEERGLKAYHPANKAAAAESTTGTPDANASATTPAGGRRNRGKSAAQKKAEADALAAEKLAQSAGGDGGVAVTGEGGNGGTENAND